jgi:4-amino-4-deoxy-L-arabinose transferase-like glycosyltransferase
VTRLGNDAGASPPAPPRPGRRPMGRRAWIALVCAAGAVGLAVRLASVLGEPHWAAHGDPSEYWLIANYLVEGKGWIEPIVYKGTGAAVQTAKLPPLYTMLLALCSLVGFKSFFAHRVWSALLSAIGVPVAAGLGRQVAGRHVGVLTAFGVALYPNLWMSASLGMSETISPITAMLVLWAAYRLRERPTVARAVLLGLAIGFAALARDEMLVFAALLLLPLAWGRRSERRAWRDRLSLAGAGLAATVAVVAPWVGYNLSRFPHPVLITDRLGLTLASANCQQTWYGPLTGYWSQSCALASVAHGPAEESAQQSVATRVALTYVEHHLGSLPRVEFDRLGRTFDFWDVGSQVDLDVHVEARPRGWVLTGLGAYYALVALAPIGVWRLRRAGLAPLLLFAPLVDVVLAVLLAYGDTRFRVTLEPVLVLSAAVAVCGFLGWPIGRDGPSPGRSDPMGLPDRPAAEASRVPSAPR